MARGVSDPIRLVEFGRERIDGPRFALGSFEMLSIPTFTGRATRWIAWGATIALSLLVVVNTMAYASFGVHHAFLVEKGELVRDTTWRACFYAHVFGGAVCLLTGPFLVSGKLLRRWPAAHRILGRAYVMSVLGCSGPAAIELSLHARGGVLGQLGFLVLGVAWIAMTAIGVERIARRRVAEHRVWMWRSYALTLSAVFFRLLQAGFYVAGVGDDVNYLVSLWSSLVVSLVVGEVLARAPSRSVAGFQLAGVES